jgi:hypothetical protein
LSTTDGAPIILESQKSIVLVNRDAVGLGEISVAVISVRIAFLVALVTNRLAVREIPGGLGAVAPRALAFHWYI